MTDDGESDHAVLRRMLDDARRLCRTSDPLLVGPYQHLHGRIAALVELTLPIETPAGRRAS